MFHVALGLGARREARHPEQRSHRQRLSRPLVLRDARAGARPRRRNIYTNLMAQRNLLGAAEVCARYIHPQAEGFTNHELWDFDHTAPDQYPLFLHFTSFDPYRKQVVKQPGCVWKVLIASRVRLTLDAIG